MSGKMFDALVAETKKMYRAHKGKNMKFPPTNMVPPYVKDVMGRCEEEARFFGVRDNHEKLVHLAYCIHIRERLSVL